jgi:hypothetical protein
MERDVRWMAMTSWAADVEDLDRLTERQVSFKLGSSGERWCCGSDVWLMGCAGRHGHPYTSFPWHDCPHMRKAHGMGAADRTRRLCSFRLIRRGDDLRHGRLKQLMAAAAPIC